MDWITNLQAWTSKTFIGNDRVLRTHYNISWVNEKGETCTTVARSFPDFVWAFRELTSLCEDIADPRDNNFMIEHYSNEPQYIV